MGIHHFFVCFYFYYSLSYYSPFHISFRHYHLYHSLWVHSLHYFSSVVHQFQALEYVPIAIKIKIIQNDLFSLYVNLSYNNTLFASLHFPISAFFMFSSSLYLIKKQIIICKYTSILIIEIFLKVDNHKQADFKLRSNQIRISICNINDSRALKKFRCYSNSIRLLTHQVCKP